MDPNATLAGLIDAAVAGDATAMFIQAVGLREWLNNGGFPPDDPRQPANPAGIPEALLRPCTCRYCQRKER